MTGVQTCALPIFALNQIEFDSRKITAGDLFLPLKGARDGHDFIQTAFDNGALATFTEKELPADQVHILVDDALEVFQKLAAYYLEKTEVDVIAVTGSNGKTTTKDMIHDSRQLAFGKLQERHQLGCGLDQLVILFL